MKTRLEQQLEHLREDPEFKIMLHNLYSQARSCARSPFEKTHGRGDFEEIAELDILTYLRSSNQIQWDGKELGE